MTEIDTLRTFWFGKNFYAGLTKASRKQVLENNMIGERLRGKTIPSINDRNGSFLADWFIRKLDSSSERGGTYIEP